MKKRFKAMAVACAVSGAVLVSLAAENTTWYGAGDLSDPFGDEMNWGRWETVDGKPTLVHRLPEPGWQIQFNPAAPALRIGDDDAAYASSLGSFYLQGTNTVYWETTTNCCIGVWIVGTGGMFYKMGKDTTLYLNGSYGNQYDYSGNITVAEGKMYLPDYGAARYTGPKPSLTNPAFVYGCCVVSNGATLVLAQAPDGKDTTSDFERLLDFGTVTNEHPSAQAILTFRSSSTHEEPSRIVGALGGKLRLGGYNCCNIENPACTYTVFYPMGSGAAAVDSTVGLMKFGLKSEDYSSMGYKGNTLRYAWDGVMFRYLGEGEETDKNFDFQLHTSYAGWAYNHPAGLDGGPHGGLVFKGTIGTSSLYNQVFRFSGENQTPCVYDGLFSIKADGDINYAPHILKDGPGVWRFNEVNGRCGANVLGLTGAFSVEEGTLQFDTLGEVSENCALGTAHDLYDKYIGAYDAAKKVTWAYSLGSTNGLGAAATEGTLECVGTETAFASRRPVSLFGHGRLKSSGAKSLHLRGVSARLAGEHTLALDGANTLSNVVSEVSDGVAGAKVSVVKEGEGLWCLKGPSSFSGDLAVKAGTLVVNANTNKFDWFRLTVRRTGGNSFLCFGEIEFFDKDGLSQNTPLTLLSGWSGNTQTIRHECTDLPPGTIFYGKSGTVNFYANGLGLMADGKVTTAAGVDYSGSAYINGANPSEGNSYNWISLVMRLPTGKNQVNSYDICTCSAGQANRNPLSWLIEGSQDGTDWQLLKDVPYDATWELPGEHCWYSDKTEFVPNAAHSPKGADYQIDGAPTPFTALANVRSVSVAPGATLKTTDANVAPISALKFGTSGAGTIDGFAFAENGTVDIVSDTKLEAGLLPLTVLNSASADALRTWKVTVNGAEDEHYVFKVSPKGVDVQKHGLCIIVR